MCADVYGSESRTGIRHANTHRGAHTQTEQIECVCVRERAVEREREIVREGVGVEKENARADEERTKKTEICTRTMRLAVL